MTDDEKLDGIPDFCRISPEQRKKNWDTVAVTDQHTGLTADAVDERIVRDQQNRAAAKREKNERGLKALRLKHHGETYDRKTKQWIRTEPESATDASENGAEPEGD